MITTERYEMVPYYMSNATDASPHNVICILLYQYYDDGNVYSIMVNDTNRDKIAITEITL